MATKAKGKGEEAVVAAESTLDRLKKDDYINVE